MAGGGRRWPCCPGEHLGHGVVARWQAHRHQRRLWKWCHWHRIISLDGAPDLTLPAGSSNPRWSFDDTFVAINGPDLRTGTGLRIFDSRTGREVLRLTGTGTCSGDYWIRGQLSVQGPWNGDVQVRVPSGELAPLAIFVNGANTEDGRVFEFRGSGSAVVSAVVAADGQVLAEVDGYGSLPGFSDQRDIFRTDGRATLFVGGAGKGGCGEFMDPQEPFKVTKPPFAD